MSLREEADSLLKKATDAGDVPGVVAMATNRDGTLYEGAFGKRILGQNAAMTNDTVVWIASMTKALTGTVAMQLVEQGKLDLSSPASEWVPELAAVQVLEGFDAAGKPRTRKPKQSITLRHLLTHTAGFSYEIWLPHKHGEGADRPLGRQPRLGGTCQHLLLDRSGERDRRRVSIAGASVRRQEISATVRRVRKDRVPVDDVIL